MTSESPVVVGVDFSPCSRAALSRAKAFASALGASLRAVHTIDGDVLEALAASLGESVEKTKADGVADALKRLREFVAGSIAPDACVVRTGSPADELIAEASACGATMIVLGVHGIGGPARGAGSFASYCVRNAPCDVALVAENDKNADVVVGVDFSPTCERAAGVAGRIAAAAGVTLHLVHVFMPPWKELHYRAPTTTTSAPFRAQYADTLRARLDRFAAERTCGAKTKTALVESSSHGGGVADYVKQVGAGLVVMGKRGRRSKLAQLVLGGTAERLLRDASTSLLAVASVVR